jgi:hypothetical protein
MKLTTVSAVGAPSLSARLAAVSGRQHVRLPNGLLGENEVAEEVVRLARLAALLVVVELLEDR